MKKKEFLKDEEFREIIKPTYIGKNPYCKINTSTAFMRMTPQPDDRLERSVAKEFSKSISDSFKTGRLARETKYGNIDKLKTETTPEFWEQFERKAKEMDVDFINYMPVMEEYVFYEIGVYGKNAVILGQEMNWDRMKTANSMLAAAESMRTQAVLGATVLELTKYLQELGYKAEGHVPFGGKLLVPPHIVASTLAIKGQMGITVTPEFGPRQRWGIITTDADIPETRKRDLSELKEFCDNCGLCIEDCIGGAVYKKPIEKPGGILTHIDYKICMETMRTNSACSVCLNGCPPGRIPKPKKLEKMLASIINS